MSSHPCRLRCRKQLIASVYHNTPFFRAFVTALDDGLNRHNPCPCQSCQQTHTKRSSSSTNLDSPPSKRARTRSPSPQSSSFYPCESCAFPHHPSRMTCPQCARRKTQPPMVQHFRVSTTPPPRNGQIPSLTDHHHQHHDTATPTTPYFNPLTTTAIPHQQDSLHDSYTPPCDPHTHPTLPPQLHLSIPDPLYLTSVQSSHLQYHSPQSTIPDQTEFTDYDSISVPPSPSSRSINHLDNHQYPIDNSQLPNHHEINVASLMAQASKVTEHPHNFRTVDRARFSLASALSDVTSESVVEIGGAENEHSKHIIHHNKSLQDHHNETDADIFLTDIIMSEKEKDPNTCNDIADLPLNFLDGMFPSINEQDVC